MRHSKDAKNIKTLSDTELQDFEEPANKSTLYTPENRQLEVIFVEPFYGGSHKQLIETIIKFVPNSHLLTLTAKKWHWRARCSALILSSSIPSITTERVLFCSSVLSLAELLGLRPDLCALKKVVYFHENQLVYPIREIKERDIQFAYNQITTCLAADVVLFNSHYNKNSFLNNIKNIIKIFPDNKPKDLRTKIEPKCDVLYFPVEFFPIHQKAEFSEELHIVWPHRWEFDKDPEAFIKVLIHLKSDNLPFRVSILGETFTDVPEIFGQAKEQLKDEIVNFGFVKDKNEYYRVLQSSHVAVSTSKHEFFGVSMLEASFHGCFPLVPNKLVYPEIYPCECLYCDDDELYFRLKQYCLVPSLANEHRNALNLDFHQYSVEHLVPKYMQLFA